MDKKCNSLCKGLWIGGAAIALTVILTKKECRETLVKETKLAKENICDSIRFVRDNREPIFDQIRSTVDEVSTVVRSITDDVKQIRETASQLKDSSKEVIDATKEAATEIKSLK